MKLPRMVIVDGVRTPFARFGTDLASLPADELGRMAVNGLLTKTGIDPEIVDEVIIGCVAQPPEAANVARVIALRAGIPRSTPAATVHRNCASGLESITSAYQRLAAGQGEVFIVGGAESMSSVPLFFKKKTAQKFTALMRAKNLGQKAGAALSFRPGDFGPVIGLQVGLGDPVSGLNMGQTAEILARENGIAREEQDAFALESNKRAAAARDKLQEEIWPAYLTKGKGSALTQDNGPRENTSLEKLAKLKPVFERKTGSVTAGNSSQITDGAAALLVMSEKKAKALQLEPLGIIHSYAYAGCDPARMGLGPVHAIARLEREHGLTLADADLIEINEAFAAQVIACQKMAESSAFAQSALGRTEPLGEIPREKLNVNGGAIALGHPVGVSGSRLVLTALKELHRRQANRALVSMCIGGGQGGAMWLERP